MPRETSFQVIRGPSRGAEACILGTPPPGQEEMTSTYTFVDYTLVQRRPLDYTLLKSSVVLLS